MHNDNTPASVLLAVFFIWLTIQFGIYMVKHYPAERKRKREEKIRRDFLESKGVPVE